MEIFLSENCDLDPIPSSENGNPHDDNSGSLPHGDNIRSYVTGNSIETQLKDFTFSGSSTRYRDLDAVPIPEGEYRDPRGVFGGGLPYDETIDSHSTASEADIRGFLRITSQGILAQRALNQEYHKRDITRNQLARGVNLNNHHAPLAATEEVCAQRQQTLDSHIQQFVSGADFQFEYGPQERVQVMHESIADMMQYLTEVQKYIAQIKQIGPMLAYSGSTSARAAAEDDTPPPVSSKKRERPERKPAQQIDEEIFRLKETLNTMRDAHELNSQVHKAMGELAQLKQINAGQATQIAQLWAEHQRLSEVPWAYTSEETLEDRILEDKRVREARGSVEKQILDEVALTQVAISMADLAVNAFHKVGMMPSLIV
ncbi:hypothetical protein HWV62_44125 [Athelia sp. TMB]|nr:hypothetical protein HWV62_44125 [Athelia sp. TMB]